MNVEQLDGFFAALIAGPEIVMPSEYNREVFGGEMSDACEFGGLAESNEILGLMMRHLILFQRPGDFIPSDLFQLTSSSRTWVATMRPNGTQRKCHSR